jgi:hypothetical protein
MDIKDIKIGEIYNVCMNSSVDGFTHKVCRVIEIPYDTHEKCYAYYKTNPHVSKESTCGMWYSVPGSYFEFMKENKCWMEINVIIEYTIDDVCINSSYAAHHLFKPLTEYYIGEYYFISHEGEYKIGLLMRS